MNQILRCDWLPEQARWSYLVRSGLPAVYRKKNFTESQVINPLLTKLQKLVRRGLVGNREGDSPKGSILRGSVPRSDPAPFCIPC